MLTDDQLTRIRSLLPVLLEASPQAVADFQRAAYFARISAGNAIFVDGDAVNAIAFVLSGVVRVYKVGETGREITLYRFGLGESCVLTASAILSRQTFTAVATVEQDVEAVLVPSDTFRAWIDRSDLWRDFVFTLLSQRLANMMEIVDEVTFRRMDVRVAALLLERARLRNPIPATHQELAAELGSSREVISRLVEDMSARGMLRAQRGSIEILDFAQLALQAAR